MKKEIQEHVEIAQETLNKIYNGKMAGMKVIVTESKLTAKSRKCFYGFRFIVENNNISINDIIQNQDKTISKIMAII